PLLEDVIREAEQRAPGKVHYSIELKVSGMSPATAERLSDRVNTCLKSVPVPASVTIQSFDAAVLRYWNRQIAAGTFLPVRLAALTTWKGVRKIERELGFRPDVYSPFYRRVTRRLIRKTHENGMKIVPWTVNSARIMRRMVRSGADGLITDYPDRFPR
ncbi:MAG: glycerophosphodiester phosphodiesterase, partial [Siphonobacter aquaeclarae]|nr:glycerophosphodiester phosphodiesterase [Siphonobacter aquaeclarae]